METESTSITTSGADNTYLLTPTQREIIFMGNRLPSDVKEEAMRIYTKYKDSYLRLKHPRSIAAACLYIACQAMDRPYDLYEIITPDNMPHLSLLEQRQMNALVRELRYRMGVSFRFFKTEQYIPRYSSDLKLPFETQRLARDLARTLPAMLPTQYSKPRFLAAATLYLASMHTREKRSQREVCDISAIVESSLRKYYKYLIETLFSGVDIDGK